MQTRVSDVTIPSSEVHAIFPFSGIMRTSEFNGHYNFNPHDYIDDDDDDYTSNDKSTDNKYV